MKKNKILLLSSLAMITVPLAAISCNKQGQNGNNAGESADDQTIHVNPDGSVIVKGILNSSQLSEIEQQVSFTYTRWGKEKPEEAKLAVENIIKKFYDGTEYSDYNAQQFPEIKKEFYFEKYFEIKTSSDEVFGHPVLYFLTIKDSLPCIHFEIRCPDRIYDGVMALYGSYDVKVDNV